MTTQFIQYDVFSKLVHLEDPSSYINISKLKIDSSQIAARWQMTLLYDSMTNDRRHSSVPYHVNFKVSIACHATIPEVWRPEPHLPTFSVYPQKSKYFAFLMDGSSSVP
jgi:hypothetical protein